jgi:hypothetical protein
MTPAPRTVECTLPGRRGGRGRRPRRHGPPHEPGPALPPGRVPRVSRLLALALRWQQLLRAGGIADYAALARLGHVSRARVSQIMNLLVLAPDIQEALLFLPRTEQGRDPIHLGQLQALAALRDWRQQRRRWQALQGRSSTGREAGCSQGTLRGGTGPAREC